MGSDLLFYAFAALTLLGSVFVVGQRNPVYSVLAIIVSFFGLAGLYVLLEAPFVAVVQIIIYAGAIMVLFLFVVMLLNVSREDAGEERLSRSAPARLGVALAVLLGGELLWALWRMPGGESAVGQQAPGISSVRELGRVLFTDYMFAFEVTSILILVAMVGAVILARKHED